MARVAFEAVGKAFPGGVEALADLTLEIEDGEFVVLVGPSGSGKTTALRILAGLEALTSGHVRIGERVVDRVPPKERDVAMVFQDYALYPQMTVFSNLAFGLRMRKVPKTEIERRVRHAAEMLDIGGLLDRKPRELSGGQRQRVALGRALVREPEVFLMDEPLSNLDAKLRTQTRGEIKRVQQEVRTTTVYVTHDQVEAMTMGDRIAVLRDGRLQQVGEPARVYAEPANLFVAGFIGSPAMTFARFTVADGALVRGALRVPAAVKGLPREVVVGVRPEHARPWQEHGDLAGPLEGEVAFVEALGRETFVGIDHDGDRFLVQVTGDARPEIGETMPFGLESRRLHVFDPDDGRSLGRA